MLQISHIVRRNGVVNVQRCLFQEELDVGVVEANDLKDLTVLRERR